MVVAILGSQCARYSPQDRHSCALRERRSCDSFHWRALCFPHFSTSSSCLLALTASWYSGRWSKVQPGPKFFLKQVHASMPGWRAQEAREGGTPVGLGTSSREVGMRSHEGSYASPRGTTILRELAGCNITFRPQIWTTSFFFVTSSASETPYFVGNPLQPKLSKLPAIKMTLISRLM